MIRGDYLKKPARKKLCIRLILLEKIGDLFGGGIAVPGSNDTVSASRL